MYPNPADSNVYISLKNANENIESITITDILGKTIKHIKQTCTLLSLNLNKSKLSVLTTVDTLLPTAACTMNWSAKSAAT